MRHHRESKRRQLDRREFLRAGFSGVSAFLGATLIPACGGGGSGGGGGVGGPVSNIGNLGPLQAADANGVMLPAGFTSKIVATSGVSPDGGAYNWHGAPDGGAVYPVAGGGWIYVSNSENGGGRAGGTE